MQIRRRDVLKDSVCGAAALTVLGLRPGAASARMALKDARIKVGGCDWSLRQEGKLGSFAVAKKAGLDGVEVSCGKGEDKLPISDAAFQKALLEEAKASPIVKARLLSSRAPFAGAWLNSPLGDPLLRLNDKFFAMAVRLRLGLPPQDRLPAKCACGALLLGDPHHFLSCHNLKTTATARHDRLLYLLARLAKLGDIATQVEVPLEDLKRPDVIFHLPSRVLATDVSVTHPSAKSYVKQAARPLGAAQARERDK